MNQQTKYFVCIKSMNIKIAERLPTIDEYNGLRQSVGWEIFEDEQIQTAMQNTLYSVCAMVEGDVVGFARIIGDRAISFFIQDMIVHQNFQRQGVGRQMMSRILYYISVSTPAKCFIGLMAAPNSSGFFEKFGFKNREPVSPGMTYAKGLSYP